MKTVLDYKQLGLVFVSGDKICGVTGDSSSNELDIFDSTICKNKYSEGSVKIGDDCYARARWTPSSFAWRNNDGFKPEYKGVIEAELNSGQKCTAYVSEITWIRGFGSSVAKWRPVVLQSDNAKKEMQEKFLSALYADSTASKNVWNAIREQFSLPSRIDPAELREAFKLIEEKYLAKEDKPMKPVYTVEMHAKGDLPPVGSEFNIEGWDGVPCTMTGIGRDNVLFIYKKNEYTIGIKDVSFKPVIKPIIKTIKVNGFDVPAPMSEAPKYGKEYFIPSMREDSFYYETYWLGAAYEKAWLCRGIMHSTKSAAISHAKAMMGIDPNA